MIGYKIALAMLKNVSTTILNSYGLYIIKKCAFLNILLSTYICRETHTFLNMYFLLILKRNNPKGNYIIHISIIKL